MVKNQILTTLFQHNPCYKPVGLISGGFLLLDNQNLIYVIG